MPVVEADAWSWRLHARCRHADPAIFFHPDGERGHARTRRQQAAKRVCADCPVIDPCLRHSVAYQEAFGTWGGLAEAERSHLLRASAVNVRTH
ncbi:WhiB family transcriptional regulator [Mycolicibacterium setense]